MNATNGSDTNATFDDRIRGSLDNEIDLIALVQPLARNWTLVLAVTVAAGALGLAGSSLWPKWYTARTLLMPPQQHQSVVSAAVSQLGALAGVAGNLSNLKSPADQYVSLLQSSSVSDRIIDQFSLVKVYEAEFRVDARQELGENVRIIVGKKDGLLTIEVDDRDPQRAADMANAYVEELRRITTHLAVTEAQQRRVFFERQLQQARDRLTEAQRTLSRAGVDEGTLKVDPRSASEGIARLKAAETAALIRLQTLRSSLTESAPDVREQASLLNALRSQINRMEGRSEGSGPSSDYVTLFRNFKYEEALFEIFAKQYELARVDESREGTLIQVVDSATKPERKAGPKRLGFAIAVAAVATILMSLVLLLRGRKVKP